ncbi:MAG: hypothetical protein HOV66_30590 [Streptomycetaceae bacterium]|nr:hypothetical protein [Streptomycetaceae bacterium]
MSAYTDEQLLDGIHAALDERDMAAAAGLIRLLAVQNPGAAQAILDAVELARTVTR